MDYEEQHARNHAEFVAWCASGKAKRMGPEEAYAAFRTLRSRVVRENLTREQARKNLLEVGIWLSIESEGEQEWLASACPIFLNLEGMLQEACLDLP